MINDDFINTISDFAYGYYKKTYGNNSEIDLPYDYVIENLEDVINSVTNVELGKYADDCDENELYSIISEIKSSIKENVDIKYSDYCNFLNEQKLVNTEKYKYHPNNKEELKALCDDLTVSLGDIDTSKITDMSELFCGSERSNEQFAGIENWDTSNVTNMAKMFMLAKNFNQNIENWDVSKVKNMFCMFAEAENFNQSLDNWNVFNVKDMKYMFSEARKFNQPLDSWNVSKVKNMQGMFWSASDFNQSLDTWAINDECSIISFADKCPIENDLTKLPKAVVEDLINKNDETYTQEQLNAVAEKFGRISPI